MDGFGRSAWGRCVAVTVVVGCSLVGLGSVASPAHAEFGPGVSCATTAVYPEFDAELHGEGPIGDCVVAVPDRTVAGAAHAGGVEVAQTGAGHVVLTRASIGQGAGRANDRFGAAIAYANLDGDAYDDLVIGAPGVLNGAGRVYVVYGSAAGLGHGRATRVLGGGVLAGSDYGSSLATSRTYLSDFSVRERLLVGAPGTRVSSTADAGAVYRYSVRYRAAEHGLIEAKLVVDPTLTEAGYATTWPAKANERFGTSIATTSCGDYVGAPGEVVGKRTGAGAVFAFSGTKAVRWTQNTKHMAGTAEKGDAFGAAISVRQRPSRIAIGAPGEDVGTKKDAGSVTVVTPKKCGATNSFTSRGFAQGAVAKSGTAEAGDRYGASVAWYDGSLDSALLVVGAPGEDVGTKKDAGAVVRLGLDRNSCDGRKPICGRVLTQSAGEYTGSVHAGNRFGSTIGFVRSDDGTDAAVVGAPGASSGRWALSQLRTMSWFDSSWFHPQPTDRLGTVAPIG